MINAPDCGYIPAYYGTYEIRDITGELLMGYGFSFTDVPDPAATVTLLDEVNNPLCLIYPTAGAGHTVQITDSSGNLIGYAINPT